jgi:hypothetical protein
MFFIKMSAAVLPPETLAPIIMHECDAAAAIPAPAGKEMAVFMIVAASWIA